MKIEKNVPLPVAVRSPGKKGKLVISMEVGDSFLVPTKGAPTTTDAARLRQMGVKYGKRLGRKYSLRSMPNGVRIWRVA
jgi:hypothetical protein